MECIGETCRYYMQHDFYASAFKCNLNGRSYTKVNIQDCIIKEVVQDMRNNLIEVVEYIKVIEGNQ